MKILFIKYLQTLSFDTINKSIVYYSYKLSDTLDNTILLLGTIITHDSYISK